MRREPHREGGDTALDDAVYLADVAEKVYVIHRRKEFRGAAVTVAKLREKENVIFVLEHQVKEIIGEQKVTGVVLEDAAVIDVNGVFVAYGAVPQTDLLQYWMIQVMSEQGRQEKPLWKGCMWQEMQEQRNCVRW